MAGPSVMVRVLGDVSKLSATFKGVGAAGKSAAADLKGAFGPALDALNKTGVLAPFHEALEGVGEALKTVRENIHDVPAAMVGVGVAVAGVGTALQAMGSKDKAAHQQLQAAVDATGKGYDDFDKQVEEAIKHQEKFGYTADQTQDALRILTQATGDPAKAMQYLGTAADLAASKHETLQVAAESMGKAYNGNTRILKEFGLQVTSVGNAQKAAVSATKTAQSADANLAHAKRTLADIEAVDAGRKKLTVGQAIQLRNAEEGVRTATEKSKEAHQKLASAQLAAKDAGKSQADMMAQLGDKLKGQASAGADTFTGKLKGLKAAAEDQISTFGQKYGESLQKAGAAMAGLGGALKIVQGGMEAAKAAALGTRIELALMSGVEKVTAAATWLLNVALDANPIVLIVLAVVALIAILVLLVTHVKAVRQVFEDLMRYAGIAWHYILEAVKAAFNWVKANWPLLLGILLGPIGLAAALIYKNFSTIKGYALDALNFIKGVWSSVAGFFSGIFGSVSRIASGTWSSVKQAASDAIAFVKSIWDGVVGFFSGIVGRIGSVLSGVEHAIEAPFQAALSTVQRVVGDIQGAVDKATSLASHIPGAGVVGGLISKLQTGGLVTKPTLALLGEAGPEMVIPLRGPHAPAPLPSTGLGVGGPAVVINHATFASDVDVDVFTRRVAFALTSRSA